MTYPWTSGAFHFQLSKLAKIPVANLLQNMERSLLRQFHLDFPHQNRGQDIRSAGCSVLRSPQPTPVASRSQSQPVAASRRPGDLQGIDCGLSLISTVTCLRWVQISPGVIGGNRIEADYSQDGSMDQNSYPLLVTAKNGVTKNPCFNVAPKLLNIHRFAWSHSAQLCYFPRTLKKKTWVQCRKIMSTFVIFSAQKKSRIWPRKVCLEVSTDSELIPKPTNQVESSWDHYHKYEGKNENCNCQIN